MLLTYNEKNNSCNLVFENNDNKIILDHKQVTILTNFYINHTTKFIFDDKYEYPYYVKNKKEIVSLLFVLFGFKLENQIIKFKNKNKYDLQSKNVTIMHNYFGKIHKKFDIVKYIPGHWKTKSGDAYIMKNPIWITKSGEYIMHCLKNNKDRHTIMCKKSYEKLKEYEAKNNIKLTFYINIGGFIMGTGRIYLHKIILGTVDKEKKSVKFNHIDKNKLNNKFDNLTETKKEDYFEDMIVNNKYTIKKDQDTYHKKNLYDYVDQNYPDLEIEKYIYGKDIDSGKDSGKKNRNSKFVMKNKKNEKFVLMHINGTIFTKISVDRLDVDLIKNTTWYVNTGGYVAGKINGKYLYLHQIITNYYGNKGNNISVDHINRDKLDNRTENLRIVNQSVQNSNHNKRSRKNNAQDLPDGITEDMIPKYCYYCSEKIKSKNLGEYTREFFRVEKHPKLTVKAWSTTKSTKVSIQDKLKAAKQKLDELNGIVEERYKLPKGITKKDKPNNKIQLSFDAKINDKRCNMRSTISNYDESKLKEYVKNFQEKIKKKYSDYEF